MSDVAGGHNATGSYLERNHRKRKDVCLLAGGDTPAQDLWCGQPHSSRSLSKGRGRAHVRSGIYEVKASDMRLASAINQDVGLTAVNMLG